MEREIRYTVLKHADLNRLLSPADQHALARIESIITASREAEGRGALQAVVVEKDWPEYEPVYKMIEDRVDGVTRQPINPVTLNGPIPGGAFELARKISEALIVDGEREGYDLEGGLYGRELSQLLVEMDSWRKKAELLQMIRALMGYVQNGSDVVLKLAQDDATMNYTVDVGSTGSEWGDTFERAIINAYNKYAEKFDD